MPQIDNIIVSGPARGIVQRGTPLLSGKSINLSAADSEKPRSDMHRLVVLGCILLFVHVGAFGVWASTVPLSSAIIATGVVKVLSKRKAVQHLEGGIVKAVFVRENEQVESGQLLAELDTTQIEASIAVLETKLFADMAIEARLEAEQNGAKKISFPEELRANAFRPEARLAIQSQEAEFTARAASLDGERKLIDQQTLQLEYMIRGVEDNTHGLGRQLAFLRDEIKDMDVLLEKGLARKPRTLALKRTEADVEAQMARNAASVAETRTKIAELDDRRRQLVYARIQDIAKQRHTTREEIGDVRYRLAALRDKLARSELRAPERGIVVGLNTKNLNAVLGPRETLLEIVPVQDRLIIEATLRPTDRDEVYVGQPARVRILAFNLRRTPTLTGKVMAVSADALTDQKTGLTYYQAEVELIAAPELKSYLSSLQPGMPVEVFLETGERTFAEYLLQPIKLRVNRAFRES
jgi:epimerase transport system membrane fusion protein